MIEGVKILRQLNEKAVEFLYKGVVFGWSLERLNNTTKEELDNIVNEANEDSRQLKDDMKKYKNEFKEMTNEQKMTYNGFFDRWNEYEE